MSGKPPRPRSKPLPDGSKRPRGRPRKVPLEEGVEGGAGPSGFGGSLGPWENEPKGGSAGGRGLLDLAALASEGLPVSGQKVNNPSRGRGRPPGSRTRLDPQAAEAAHGAVAAAKGAMAAVAGAAKALANDVAAAAAAGTSADGAATAAAAGAIGGGSAAERLHIRMAMAALQQAARDKDVELVKYIVAVMLKGGGDKVVEAPAGAEAGVAEAAAV